MFRCGAGFREAVITGLYTKSRQHSKRIAKLANFGVRVIYLQYVMNTDAAVTSDLCGADFGLAFSPARALQALTHCFGEQKGSLFPQ